VRESGSYLPRWEGPGTLPSVPRILIADDDAGVRSVLARHLASAGYEVLEAADGRGCLDVLRTTPLDLIICDIYMPDVDGIAVIAQAHRDFPHVPIVAISGGGTVPRERTLEIAERLGATRTLTKPFDLGALMASVRELLPGS
jgi:CheY-like chemotaxis protein